MCFAKAPGRPRGSSSGQGEQHRGTRPAGQRPVIHYAHCALPRLQKRRLAWCSFQLQAHFGSNLARAPAPDAALLKAKQSSQSSFSIAARIGTRWRAATTRSGNTRPRKKTAKPTSCPRHRRPTPRRSAKPTPGSRPRPKRRAPPPRHPIPDPDDETLDDLRAKAAASQEEAAPPAPPRPRHDRRHRNKRRRRPRDHGRRGLQLRRAPRAAAQRSIKRPRAAATEGPRVRPPDVR